MEVKQILTEIERAFALSFLQASIKRISITGESIIDILDTDLRYYWEDYEKDLLKRLGVQPVGNRSIVSGKSAADAGTVVHRNIEKALSMNQITTTSTPENEEREEEFDVVVTEEAVPVKGTKEVMENYDKSHIVTKFQTKTFKSKQTKNWNFEHRAYGNVITVTTEGEEEHGPVVKELPRDLSHAKKKIDIILTNQRSLKADIIILETKPLSDFKKGTTNV